MDFKQLKSFATVARCHSFTKAAEQLYTSQSTVSAHIQQLEEELKTPLFLRTTKSIQITEKGQELYEYAVNILTMRERMIQLGQKKSHHVLHIGASTIPSQYILPKMLASYQLQEPKNEFTLYQSDSQNIVEGVKDGLYDVGIIGMKPEEENLICYPLCDDRLVLITPVNPYFTNIKDHAMDVTENLVRDYAQIPFILREKGSGSGKSGSRYLESIGIQEEELCVVARMQDQNAMIQMVEQGLGVAIVSERSIMSQDYEKRIFSFELSGNCSSRKIYLLYRKDQIIKGDVGTFLRFAKEYL